MRIRSQRGFTLIELVMIIVILGILAATAVIRYVDLQAQAEEAAIKGIYGHMVSAYGISIASLRTNPSISEVNANIGGTMGDLWRDTNGDGAGNDQTMAIQTGQNTILGAQRFGYFTVTGDPITDIGDLTVTAVP